MPRILAFLSLAFVLLMPQITHSQPNQPEERRLARLEREAECPPGYKCLKDEDAAEIARVLQHHNCLVREAQQGRMRLTFDEQKIVITQDGQVFTDDTLTGKIEWCEFKLGFETENNVAITKPRPPVEPNWGLRLRVKVGVTWLPANLGEDLPSMFDPALVFEPFFWRMLHVQAQTGFQHGGISLGADITKNLDFFGGAAIEYGTWELMPIFGLSLSFN